MKNLVIVDIKTQKKFLRDFPKKNWIIFYNWNNCGFCHRIRPVWDNLVKKNRNSNLNFAEIEQNLLSKKEIQSFLEKTKTKIPHFPFFVEYINEGSNISNKIIPDIEEFKNNNETIEKSENIKLLKSNEIKKSKKKSNKKKKSKKKFKKPISGKKFLKKKIKKSK